MSRGSAAKSAAASTALSLLAAFALLHSCAYDWETAGGGPTTPPTSTNPTSSTSTAGSGGSGATAASGGGASGGAGSGGATAAGGSSTVVGGAGGGGGPCSAAEYVCGEQLLCCARVTEFCLIFMNGDSDSCRPCTGCSADTPDPCAHVLGNLVSDEECSGATCAAGAPDSADEGAIWVTCP